VADALLALKELIRISSNQSRICPLCDFELDGIHNFEMDFNRQHRETYRTEWQETYQFAHVNLWGSQYGA